MKLKLISAIAAGLLCSAPAFSATATTLDFQGLGGYTFIEDFYNGVGGPNYGISFGPDALAVENDEFFTYYQNAPTPGAFSAVGANAALNVAAGFTGQVSFFYAATENTFVNVYSGLNGTGSLLGTFALAANTGACTEVTYCQWDFASLTLEGIAKSIQFGNTAGVAGFDNITVAAVPVPAAGWMLLSGLGALGAAARRKRNA